MRILLVEDDPQLAHFIQQGLSQAGHWVAWCDNGKAALVEAMNEDFDVAIVDRMIPQLDGLSLVKALRAAQVPIPVLFLTAVSGVDDRVAGLEAGGDDYLTKPFAFSELLARLSALTRRAQGQSTQPETRLCYGDLCLDLLSRCASRQQQPLQLKPKEWRMLELFLRHPERVITRTMLLEHVWEIHFDPQTSVIETLISRLRAQIEKPFGDRLIHTVRGAGYKLEKRF